MTPAIASLVGLALATTLVYAGMILPSFDHNNMTIVDGYMKTQVQAVIDSMRLQAPSAAQAQQILIADPRLNDTQAVRVLDTSIRVTNQGQYLQAYVPYEYRTLFNIRFVNNGSPFPTIIRGQPLGNAITAVIDRV